MNTSPGMSNNNATSSLFSPLNKEFCIYFYYLSVFGFALLVFTLLSAVALVILKKKGFDFVLQMILLSLGYFIFYFQNRLLYSMCVNSL